MLVDSKQLVALGKMPVSGSDHHLKQNIRPVMSGLALLESLRPIVSAKHTALVLSKMPGGGSDRRLKQSIKPVKNGLSVVGSLQPVALSASATAERRLVLSRMPVSGGSDSSLKQNVKHIDAGLNVIGALQPVTMAGASKIQKTLKLDQMPQGGSDTDLKQDVVALVDGLDKIMALRPVSWEWKAEADRKTVDDATQYGFIAQEVEKVVPDLVGKGAWNDGRAIKTLAVTDMIPYLVAAIKEQQEQIAELKKELSQLEPQKA